MRAIPDPLLNTVYLGDVMELMAQLPDESVDMVFSDPDYNVGVRYSEGRTYTRSFDEYIEWYIQLARESLRVLKPTGNAFFINYPKQNAYLRVRYLDEACYDVQDYVWVYNTNVGQSPRRFTTAHRSILHARKTKENQFFKDQVAQPYQNPTDKRIRQRLANGHKGRMPYSWFYFDLVKNVSREKTIHACQIPQKLSAMLILSCTLPGDVVLVHFGGSGAELEVCQALGRQFVSAEIDPVYHQMILDRLARGQIADKYRLMAQRAPQTLEEQLNLIEP
ncbi:MAG: site-specific DNA-methyltransferase [Fimbriimonadales bacterium]